MIAEILASIIPRVSDLFVGLAVFLFFILLLVIIGLWPKDHSLYRPINNFITLYVIFGLLLLVYLIVTHIQVPYSLSIFIVVPIFLSLVTGKYMMAPYTPSSDRESLTHSEKEPLSYLSNHRYAAILVNSLVPIMAYTAAYVAGFTVVAESARTVLSDIFLVFSGLLIIAVTFYIFIVERRPHQIQSEASIHHKIASILVQRVQILGLLYLATILLSVVSLLSMKNDALIFVSSQVVTNTLFAVVIYLASYSLIFTIIVFNQIVGVYKSEWPTNTKSQQKVDEQIQRLQELKEQGVLTEQEFSAKKKELLSKM